MLNAALKEFDFTSGFDGLDISAVIAVPMDEPVGIVQIIHGMNEYKERYYDFIDYLAEQGFISVIHDSRGHGKSICTDDDLGFMFRNGGEAFVADIAQLNKLIHEQYPSLPYFMIGHSMGSLGARCFLKEHDSDINGLLLIGSPSYSRFTKFFRSIASAASDRKKGRFRSEKIYELSEKLFNKNFGGEPHSWICSRKEVVDEFNSNPLSNFKYTLNGYGSLMYLFKETYSGSGWQVNSPQLPIRFISGKNDPVMLSEKKFFQAIEHLRKIGYESISHRFFDNMRHEILNEKNNIMVYRDIAKTLFSWIDRLNNN